MFDPRYHYDSSSNNISRAAKVSLVYITFCPTKDSFIHAIQVLA